MNTNFENLSKIKSQLFDAPTEVKTAFNTVCQYFDGKPKPTFEESIKGTVKDALQIPKKFSQDTLNNRVLKSIPEDYVYLEDNAIHQYLKGHASYTGELGDYVIYKYDGKNFPVLINFSGFEPIFGDKSTLKSIWNKVH